MPKKVIRFEPGGRHAAQENDNIREVLQEDPVQDMPDPVEHPALKSEKNSMRVSKSVYRIIAVLLAAALLLVVLENREELTPGNIGNWIKTKAVGFGFGDGYPTDLTGSTANPGNFGSVDGDVYVVSDTALTVMNGSAKELFSVRHSYNDPAVSVAGGRYLLYNAGGTGYQVNTASGTEIEAASETDITVAAMSESGKFALALQPADYAAELCVYMKNGTPQYSYKFADTYISAIALNREGTRGAVATVTSKSGELVSTVTVLDFSKEEPLATYECRGNMILGLVWSATNRIIAVGDTRTLVSDAQFRFDEYDYEGRTVTAFGFSQSRAAVSVSNYAFGGNSTMLVFENNAKPVSVELPGRVEWIACQGTKAAALLPDSAVSVDMSLGKLEAACDITADTKCVAVADEGSVYLMGVREIRKENLKIIRNAEELFQND